MVNADRIAEIRAAEERNLRAMPTGARRDPTCAESHRADLLLALEDREAEIARFAETRGLVRDLTTCLENRNAEIVGLREEIARREADIREVDRSKCTLAKMVQEREAALKACVEALLLLKGNCYCNLMPQDEKCHYCRVEPALALARRFTEGTAPKPPQAEEPERGR